MIEPTYEAPDAEFAARVRASFAQQSAMRLIGARMVSVEPGLVVIELPMQPEICQQDGFVHGGIVTTIVDSACGYAALTLMEAGSRVLTIEFKVNFMAPAIGERLLAYGRVKKTGRTVSVCTGDVMAVTERGERLVATMLTSMMALRPQPDESPL